MSPTNSIRGTTQRKLSDRSTRLARQRGVQAGQGGHPLPGRRLCEAVAVALSDDDVGVVEQPVDGRGGEGLGHDLVEPGRVEVRTDRQGAAFVGGVDEPVEPFGGIR
jgi:hypothetical protein